MIFDSLGRDEAVVVMNALTQRNIADETPRICYRQINPARFLSAIGLPFESVEQLMTNDAHVFFGGQAQRDHAAAALERATIHGKPLFHVEPNAANPQKLFYQVDFWDELEGDIEVEVGGRKINFLDHFEAIVARTGAHVRDGNVFSSGIELPSNLYNHEIAAGVLGFFAVTGAGGVDAAALPDQAGSRAA